MRLALASLFLAGCVATAQPAPAPTTSAAPAPEPVTAEPAPAAAPEPALVPAPASCDAECYEACIDYAYDTGADMDEADLECNADCGC
jgi:hypothetical protein